MLREKRGKGKGEGRGAKGHDEGNGTGSEKATLLFRSVEINDKRASVSFNFERVKQAVQQPHILIWGDEISHLGEFRKTKQVKGNMRIFVIIAAAPGRSGWACPPFSRRSKP